MRHQLSEADKPRRVPPKVVSLTVRPLHAAHLSFEIGGILEEVGTHLGAVVPAFHFSDFYAELASFRTVSGDPSRLVYDFSEIMAKKEVHLGKLARLRAEPIKAALNKAINARQNAYFAKYANASDIIARINEYYSPVVSGSKPMRLQALRTLAENHWNMLWRAYMMDRLAEPTVVVKYTQS